MMAHGIRANQVFKIPLTCPYIINYMVKTPSKAVGQVQIYDCWKGMNIHTNKKGHYIASINETIDEVNRL